MGQHISRASYCSVQGDAIPQIDPYSERLQLVDLVINNHLIMDTIAGMLSLKDIKNCRRVSKSWKKSMQQEFLKRSQIKILDACQRTCRYLRDATSDLGHMNYTLLICDINENYIWSLRLFPSICSKFGQNMKNLAIDIDINSATSLEVFGPGINPIPSLETLEFRLTIAIACKPNRKQTKRVVKEIVRIFPNIKHLNVIYHDVEFPSFQTKLLQAMGHFNGFVGGRFQQPSQYPYSIRTMKVLTGMTQNLKIIDLLALPPISKDAGPVLEKLLARFRNSLEVFRVTVGRSRKRTSGLVCVPVMRNLKELEIGYNATPYHHPTEIHLRFHFGPNNFSQNLPILQTFRFKVSRMNADATGMACKPLFDCLFPENLSDLRCTSVTKLEISHPALEYGRMQRIFPNAKISSLR